MRTKNKSTKLHPIRWLKLCMAVIILATISIQVLHTNHAYADDGGYPWVGATPLYPYPPDYDWGYYPSCPSGDTGCMSLPVSYNGNTYGAADPWVYYVRNCTSYVAWKIAQVFPGTNISGWGDAYKWSSNAPSNEVHAASGYTPQVGDIAQWVGHDHVAYVYAVNNGVASFYEYNSGYPKDQNGNLQWGLFYSGFTSANYPIGGPDNYIHIGTITTPPPPEVNYQLVRLGSIVQAKAGLNTGWTTEYSNASDMQAAGTRMAFKDATTGHIWAMDTLTGTKYDEGTADQYVVTSSYLIERLGNVLQAKAGLNDNWTSLYSWATDVKAAGTRIAIIDTSGNLMAKDTLNGSWYTESNPTVNQYAVTPYYLLARLGSVVEEKAGLNTSWQTQYTNASDMQAAGKRMAFKDATTGHIWAIDYGVQSPTQYDEGTPDQYVVTSEYFVHRLNNYLEGKAGLNDPWTYLYSWATDVKAAGQRIAIIDTLGNLNAKDQLTGSWYTESNPTIAQYAATTSVSE